MLQVDLTNDDFFRDPRPQLRRLREAGPVVEVKLPLFGRVWMATTQEAACARAQRQCTTFSLRKPDGNVAGIRWWMPRVVRTLASNMLTVDEPDHTRLRGIVEEAFRRRAVLEMQPRIRSIADDTCRRPLRRREARPIWSIVMRACFPCRSSANCSDFPWRTD